MPQDDGARNDGGRKVVPGLVAVLTQAHRELQYALGAAMDAACELGVIAHECAGAGLPPGYDVARAAAEAHGAMQIVGARASDVARAALALQDRVNQHDLKRWRDALREVQGETRREPGDWRDVLRDASGDATGGDA